MICDLADSGSASRPLILSGPAKKKVKVSSRTHEMQRLVAQLLQSPKFLLNVWLLYRVAATSVVCTDAPVMKLTSLCGLRD